MLHILVFCLLMCLLTPFRSFADEQGVNFFKQRKPSPQTEECSECSKMPNALDKDLKEKNKEIENLSLRNFLEKQSQIKNEIILFIDPDCGLSDAAVNALVRFKKDFPGWHVKGVIVTDTPNLKKKLLRKRSYFSNDIEFSVDIGRSLVKEFNITKVPAYLINYEGKYYKIAGQPDLNETISKLDK